MSGAVVLGSIAIYAANFLGPPAGYSQAVEQARYGKPVFTPKACKLFLGPEARPGYGPRLNPRFVIDGSLKWDSGFEVGVGGPINGKFGKGQRPLVVSRHACYAGSADKGVYGIVAVRTGNQEGEPLFKPPAAGIRYSPLWVNGGFFDVDANKKAATFTGTADINLPGGVVASPFMIVGKEHKKNGINYYGEMQVTKGLWKKIVAFVRGEYSNKSEKPFLKGEASAVGGIMAHF
jgi:hypothetical protein